MFHIGICDDETSTCAELEEMIYSFGQRTKIKTDVTVWYTGEEICDYLQNNNPLDILFLDIELISTDGIRVGNFIREELDNFETIIIYISVRNSYAMSLFKVQPLDFLIKPLTADKVEDALRRSIKIYERKNRFFQYHTREGYFKIPYKEIMFFYSRNKKIIIVTINKHMEFNGKLKDIAQSLSNHFIQIHHSYLINLDFVSECRYESVKMRNGDVLNISQPYRKAVRAHIMENNWKKDGQDD